MKKPLSFVMACLFFASTMWTYSFATDCDSTTILIDDFQITNGRSGTGLYWDKSTLNIYFGTGFSNSEVESIETAINEWSSVSYPSPTNHVDFTFVTDDVTYGTADVIFIKDVLALGNVGEVGLYDSQMNLYDGTTGGVIYKAIVTLSTAVYFCVSGSPSSSEYDLKTVVEHEMGHVLGIAHCHEKNEIPPCGYDCSNNVMYPLISTGETRRTLQNYDKASLVYIYNYQHPFS